MLLFSAPDPVRLATGASLAELEVDAGPPLYVGEVDIADAFYAIELPEWLRAYFGLGPCRARDVGCTHLADGSPVGPNDVVEPCIKVCPMGFSLSLGICQSVHEHAVSNVEGVREDEAHVEGGPI